MKNLVIFTIICIVATFYAGCNTVQNPAWHGIFIGDDASLHYKRYSNGEEISRDITLDELKKITLTIFDDDTTVVNYPNWHNSATILQKVINILDQNNIKYISGAYGPSILREVEEGVYVDILAKMPDGTVSMGDEKLKAEVFTDHIYIMEQGDTLWKLGKERYGNRHYSKIISIHNNITEPSKIQINTVIQVPELKTLLSKEKLTKVANKEIELILKARKLFLQNESLLLDIREKKLNIPKKTQRDLLLAAECINKAIVGLDTEKNGVKKNPKKMIGQLKNLSKNLKLLAKGGNDGYAYDLDMVHQRMVYALLNGIKWARNGFE